MKAEQRINEVRSPLTVIKSPKLLEASKVTDAPVKPKTDKNISMPEPLSGYIKTKKHDCL